MRSHAAEVHSLLQTLKRAALRRLISLNRREEGRALLLQIPDGRVPSFRFSGRLGAG
jgi:hypothetical protein